MEDEQSLVAMAQRGEVAAFEALIEEYETRIYNLAYRMLGDSEDARDAAQETFLKAYSALGRFRGDASFSTWIYRIARNSCLDAIRMRKRNRTYSLDDPVDTVDGEVPRQMEGDLPAPDEVVLTRERQAVINGALAELSDHHRSVLLLRDIEGFSYEEIAEVLQVRLGTVKSRLYRARTALHDRLEQMELFRDHIVWKSEGRGNA